MHTKDLTTGSPMKLILSFMLPLVFGLLFQQVYSMVDTIVVGKFLGVDALAGVGSTGSITFLVLGLCNGVCAGFAIPVAQKFGQRDFDGLRRFVGNMIWLSCVIAAAATLVMRRVSMTMAAAPSRSPGRRSFGVAKQRIFMWFPPSSPRTACASSRLRPCRTPAAGARR